MRGDFKSAKSESQCWNVVVVVNVLYLFARKGRRNVHISRRICRGGGLRRWGWRRRRRMAWRPPNPSGSASLRDDSTDRRRVFGPVLGKEVVGSGGGLPNVRIHQCRALRYW